MPGATSVHSSILISIEGIEGCGKSTLIKSLGEHFLNSSWKVHVFREPGSTSLGEDLRQILLRKKENPLHSLSELFLFLSARVQLIEETLAPLLSQPKQFIILDRFLDSSLVYQGIAGGLGLQTVLDLHSYAPLTLRPHRTYLLELSPEESLARQKLRGKTPDYFEERGKTYLSELAKGYEQVSKLFPQRIYKINAHLTPQEVLNQVVENLGGLLGKN